MSDDTKSSGPAHRAETISSLKARMNGIHAAAKEPHLNNAQVHKGLRDVAGVLDHTLEILETVAGEAAEARRKADEALEKADKTGSLEDIETVAALRRRVVQLKRHERKLMEYRQSADTIRAKAESPNELKQRMASSDAEGLRDEVAEILSEIEGSVQDVNRKVGDLDQRLTDEAERLDGRITDHEKAVDERFTNERKETDDKIEKIKPSKEGKGLSNVKSDIAALSQRVDSHRAVINERPSLAPIAVGVAVGLMVFVVIFFATVFSPAGFNFWTALVISFGFGFATTGLIYVIQGHRQKQVETTTETRTETGEKPGIMNRIKSRLDSSGGSSDKYEEEPATEPVKTSSKKETVTTR